MKKAVAALFLLFFVVLFSKAQAPVNWTAGQVMEPAELAGKLSAGKDVPLIYSVGPGSTIPHSIAIGPVNDSVNLERFKSSLKTLPKDASIVVYCGCCPFEHCPNVRPAIAALKEQHFNNYKLLNLSHNLKTDWIDKGYPVVK